MSSKDQRHPLSYRYYREKNSSRSLHPRPGRRSARCTSARTRACVRSAATRSSRAASVTSARASRRLFHGPTHRFFKFEHTVFFFFFFSIFSPQKVRVTCTAYQLSTTVTPRIVILVHYEYLSLSSTVSFFLSQSAVRTRTESLDVLQHIASIALGDAIHAI